MFLGDKMVILCRNILFFMKFQISISTFLWDEIEKPLLYQLLINTALCIPHLERLWSCSADFL